MTDARRIVLETVPSPLRQRSMLISAGQTDSVLPFLRELKSRRHDHRLEVVACGATSASLKRADIRHEVLSDVRISGGSFRDAVIGGETAGFRTSPAVGLRVVTTKDLGSLGLRTQSQIPADFAIERRALCHLDSTLEFDFAYCDLPALENMLNLWRHNQLTQTGLERAFEQAEAFGSLSILHRIIASRAMVLCAPEQLPTLSDWLANGEKEAGRFRQRMLRDTLSCIDAFQQLALDVLDQVSHSARR